MNVARSTPPGNRVAGRLARTVAAPAALTAARTLLLGWILFVTVSLPRLVCAAALTDGPTVQIHSASNVVVRWATDVATGARVRYGTALSHLNQSVQDKVGSHHSVTLTGLRPGTKYFYTVGTARLPLATNFFSTPSAVGTVARTAEVKPAAKAGEVAPAPARPAPPTRETWGALGSLRDHFERHGADFKAKDADDYARQAWEFRQRARAEGLPTKVDEEGVIRVFDPKTRAFAAYNRDGTTKTYFKPNSRDYFDRQPGRLVNPKTLNF